METLTGIDATFLSLETRNSPMHVGGVVFVDGSSGGLDFDHYRALIKSRLHLSRIFRRRLVEVPMQLGRPVWVEDPHFDLDAHVQHAALPRPGRWPQLRKLAEHIFRLPLDLRMPLWSLTFVEGLGDIDGVPPGSFAVIHKIHHAAVDGMGAMDLWNALWDPTPVIRTIPPKRDWRPEALPTAVSLLARTARGMLASPAEMAQAGTALVKGGINMGRELATHHQVRVASPFSAPHTRFNDPITSRRVFDGVFLDLGAIKSVKDAIDGATVNDVVLAVCAGALRRYLSEMEELPDKPLVAMAPISVRGDSGGIGNKVSAMLVPLATNVDDPLARLKSIHDSAANSKEMAGAIGAGTLMDTAQVVPFSLGTAAARLYCRMDLARFHRPPFNLVITNVPGPRQPLYLGGNQLLASFGMAPVFDGLGMIIVITSYMNTLAISVTACRDVLPDVDVFVSYLVESFDELKDAVAAAPVRKSRRKASGKKKRSAAARKKRRAKSAGDRPAKARKRKTRKT